MIKDINTNIAKKENLQVEATFDNMNFLEVFNSMSDTVNLFLMC
jgi:hypothetical protein